MVRGTHFADPLADMAIGSQFIARPKGRDRTEMGTSNICSAAKSPSMLTVEG
jgi:hypothetical protein